jgi:thiamine biosynthesis lipoprotein
VAATTCAQAEVAAKAAFLLGPKAGSRFLAGQGLTGLFVLPDGSERRAGRWSAS